MASDLDMESTHAQPPSCRARPVNVDDGLSRRRKVARGVVGSSPRPEKVIYFAIGEGSRLLSPVFYLVHSSAPMYLYQTPGPRPPRITGRVVDTVTRGWVGAPNERAPFTFHGAVVGFVHRYLSRARNLAASNYHLADFCSARSWPHICPRFCFRSGFC